MVSGEIVRPAVVILKHQNQPLHAGTRNEHRSDPIVELTSHQVMRVGAVGRNRLNTSAAHQLVVQIGIGLC